MYNDVDVRFVLYFTEEGYDALKENVEKFEKQFKMTSSWETTNMTCFDKYKTFVQKRLPMYEVRRFMMMENLEKQMRELDVKQRFIQSILNERLVLFRRSDEVIVAQLKACEIPALSNMDAPDAYDSYDTVCH